MAMTASPLTDGVIVLRSWQTADAPAIVECVDGDEELARWLDQIPQPYRVEDALGWLAGETPRGNAGEVKWAILDDGRIAGSIGATPHGDDVWEIGYWTRAEARGRGVMTRALVLVTRWAVEQGAQRVQLRADPENVASCRVAEKAGFTREGVLRSARWNERLGRRQDWAMYSLLPDEL